MVVLLGSSVVQGDQTEHRLSVTIPLPAHTIIETDSGHRVSMEGFGALRDPGIPQLPVRIFPIAIPPGAEVVRVTHTAANPVTLPKRCDLAPAPIWEPIGRENPPTSAAEQQRFDANHSAIYGTDELFPATPVEFMRAAGYRGYNLVDVRVMPLAYRPISKQLVRYTDITVHVDYRLAERAGISTLKPSRAIQRSAQELILNYDQAAAWYAAGERTRTDQYEFVVITLEGLIDAVAPLVAWEQQKGRNVQVVTTSWIMGNYPGVDLPARFRNFLRDKYAAEAWGIEHVLLVGHYSDLPMRVVWQDLGYGYPQTDMYYAELSLPDEQSWDSDQDGHYADEEDQIDFHTEISVGRIPWSDPATVQHICQKSVLFEQDHDPTYKQHILLLGSFFWPDTDTALLMETIAALPHLADWTGTRMYEAGYSSYPMDDDITQANVVSEWSSGTYSVVTWGGHGSPTSAHRYYPNMPAFIASTDCPVLDDSHPSIVFATSCYTSSPYHANLGREMLGQGAIGYVGATQVAGGRRAWETPADGSSQTLNYLFTNYVTSGLYPQGEALQFALRETYLQGAWRWPKYEVLEWAALYGNPDLSAGVLPALHIQFPDGLPDHVTRGAETSFVVRIDPVQDTLVADSATLRYRLDSGPFQSTPLNALGSKRYEAVLPPTDCDDVAEFYVSAAGTISGPVTQPENAPDEVFTATVGTFATVFHDDFEQDHGWLAENLGATDGDWERGVPVNDPYWFYDPFADADGSGQCYLTANRFGDSDVDGGGVRLTSPLVDMTAENITLRYSYYLYAENQDTPDYLLVEVSSNDMAGPWHELVRHVRNNGWSWRTDSFTNAELQALGIELTNQMRVRFTAHDSGAGYVLEAGLDAFEVLRFGCGPGHDAVPPGPEPVDSACTVAGDCTGPFAGADCVAGRCYVPKNRYLSIDPTVNENAVAYQVEIIEAADYPTAVGRTWWVDEPVCHDYPNGNPVLPAPPTCAGADRFGWVAMLTSTPVTREWSEVPLHVTGCGIVPNVGYEVRASADEGGSFSDALRIGTAADPDGPSQSWGDVTGGPVEGMPGLWLAPDGSTNMADVGNAIRTFENRTEDTGFPPRVWVDVEVNRVINLGDVQFIVGAFEGSAYADLPDLPFIGVHPADCP